MDEYAKLCDWFMDERPAKPFIEKVTVDPDGELNHWCRIMTGTGTFSKFAHDRARLLNGQPLEDDRVYSEALQAIRRIEAAGGGFAFTTPGDGTTSADTPLMLFGNFPYHGVGPLKYLNGEFNRVTLMRDGAVYAAKNGGTLKLPAGEYRIVADVGNLAAAKWLAGTKPGDTAVKCGGTLLTLEKDAAYTENVSASGNVTLTESGELVLRLTAIDRADFGETFRVYLEIQ